MSHLSLAHNIKVFFHKVLKHKCKFKHMTSGTVSEDGLCSYIYKC